jgi:hypothetical protein
VDPDAAHWTGIAGRHGDVDGTRRSAQHSPASGGAAAAERCAGPAREDGRQMAAVLGWVGVAKGVDAAVDGVQAGRSDAGVDRATREAQLEKLPAGDHPVLLGGQPRDRPLPPDAENLDLGIRIWSSVVLTVYMTVNPDPGRGAPSS